MRYVGQSDEAEDVVQEAFIKMFQRLGDYKREVTIGAWLRKIVVNLAIDKLRIKKGIFVDIEENQLTALTDSETDWYVEDDVTPQLIRSAIEKLPETIRYVTQLYLVEGYDHQEISEILKITEVNSRTMLMRGRNKIKEQLKNSMHGTRY
jgi:RNA polymerase sigma-70 factor (ECF subfamily)